MTEEQKTEEKHEHHKHEEHAEHKKLELSIKLGNNKRDILENLSFYIIVISAIMIAIGIGLGSFIQGTVYLSLLGSFFVMVGIVFYIASQFIEVKNG